MTIINIAPYLISIAAVIGLLLIRQKNRLGFLVWVAKECVFIWYCFATKQYGFLLAEPVFIIINISAYIKWKKDDTLLEME